MIKKISAALLVGFAVLGLGDAVKAQESKEIQIGPDGFAIPPGGARAGNKVLYENGRVVLEFEDESQPEHSGPHASRCPRNWYCLFQDAGWHGRMLRFSDPGRQSLGNYGFRDAASSWVNNLSRRVAVENERGAGVIVYLRLWCSAPRSQSSWVGPGANDKADDVYIGGC